MMRSKTWAVAFCLPLGLFLFFSFSSLAGPVNQAFSYRVYPIHGLSFKGVAASKFNNTDIVGTCFYQEWVEGDVDLLKDIFPTGMTGVTFIDCNLDNIFIPPGNTVLRGSNRGLKVQNDWQDWIVDKTSHAPLEPIDKKKRQRAGANILPGGIPVKRLTEKQKQDFERTIEVAQ